MVALFLSPLVRQRTVYRRAGAHKKTEKDFQDCNYIFFIFNLLKTAKVFDIIL